jgi:hypothetical protein
MSDEQPVPGWSSLVEWLGYSPNFHDAEVVSVNLRRDPEPSEVRIAFSRIGNEIAPDGTYRQDRHAHALFTVKGIKALRLEGWNHQNVLSELWVDKVEGGFVLHLPEIFGVEGEIHAEYISVDVEALVEA